MRYTASDRPEPAIVTANNHAPDLAAAPLRQGGVAMHPRLVAALAIVVLAAAGGIYLGLMVADAARSGGFAHELFEALCRADFAGETSVARFALVLLMWCAMVLVMMLPTASPMVMTYAQIADTASRKGERVASPLVLIAGFTAVWFDFALAATALQAALVAAALLDPSLRVAGGLLSGAIFLAAGAYQFSALKHACLTRCRQPFPFFFANWTPQPVGVFRLGLRQGVYCVGCCWAMMLVMFAVGVMNVAWMAALGIAMAIEKTGTGLRFTRMVGAILVTIGVIVLAWSIAAHWPVRSG
jgi:predicted metal-binding membrane protein